MAKNKDLSVSIEAYCEHCQEVVEVDDARCRAEEYIRCPRCGHEREVLVNGEEVGE